MKFGVVQFPGSNCDQDMIHAFKHVLGCDAFYLWHKDADLRGADALLIPGGFSFGDYLRCGAIARFSPIMRAVAEFAARGGPVVGVCNGFQILCEAGLLPGALLRNRDQHFICDHVLVRVDSTRSPVTGLTQLGQILRLPIAHGEGNYFADEDTLDLLEQSERVIFRYCDAAGQPTEGANPNGSRRNIAGICNEGRNVVGMMPHPERAAEFLLGSTDGLYVFESLLGRLAGA